MCYFTHEDIKYEYESFMNWIAEQSLRALFYLDIADEIREKLEGDIILPSMFISVAFWYDTKRLAYQKDLNIDKLEQFIFGDYEKNIVFSADKVQLRIEGAIHDLPTDFRYWNSFYVLRNFVKYDRHHVELNEFLGEYSKSHEQIDNFQDRLFKEEPIEIQEKFTKFLPEMAIKGHEQKKIRHFFLSYRWLRDAAEVACKEVLREKTPFRIRDKMELSDLKTFDVDRLIKRYKLFYKYISAGEYF